MTIAGNQPFLLTNETENICASSNNILPSVTDTAAKAFIL